MANQNSYTLSLPVGSEIVLTVETDLNKAKGAFAKQGKVQVGGSEKTLLNGFCVEFESVGTISLPKDDGQKGDSVQYNHLKAAENRIYFYADSGEQQVINVINIPIHDHSSVVQGGPAFGTYYSDFNSTNAPPSATSPSS